MRNLDVVPREILLADDDDALRRMLAEALVREGYRVTEVDSGHLLLQRLAERTDSMRGFDLIISDVRMPGFTGLEVAESLLDPDGDAPLRDTPVILISAFGGADLATSARQLGAYAMDKPFAVSDLLSVTRAVLALRSSTCNL